MKYLKIIFTLHLGMLCCGILGCSPSNPLGRESIKGQVTLNGKPLEKGAIEFTPIGEGHATNTSSGGSIVGGFYSVESQYGITPGEYRVSINASMRNPNPTPGPPNDPDYVAHDLIIYLIPTKYNRKSELRAIVKKGGPNVFDFQLEGNPIPNVP